VAGRLHSVVLHAVANPETRLSPDPVLFILPEPTPNGSTSTSPTKYLYAGSSDVEFIGQAL
jgi:hypothetical protein